MSALERSIDPLIVDCEGDGLARGRAHGEQLRPLVRESIARWEDATTQTTGITISHYVDAFLGATRLASTLETLTPDLMAEIRGIAEGAAVPLERVLAFNLMDEQWWYDLNPSSLSERGCSVVAACPDGGPLILSQNMDLPAFMDGGQAIMRLKAPDTPEALVLTCAGLIGLAGVNRDGLGVCVNALLMLDHSPNGLPVAAATRVVLTHKEPQSAVSFLLPALHASGQHYAIGSPEGVVGVECSASGSVVSRPMGRKPLLHTNHPQANQHIHSIAERYLTENGRIEDSRRRQAYLDSKAESLSTVSRLKDVLADRSAPIRVLPTPQRQSKTFASVLFEFEQEPKAYFCLGSVADWRWDPVQW